VSTPPHEVTKPPWNLKATWIRLNLWEMQNTAWTPKHEGVHTWCYGARVRQGL